MTKTLAFALSLLAVPALAQQAKPAQPATPATTAKPAATPAAPAAAAPVEHAMVTPAEMKWGPAHPGLPAGAQMTVLYGDPSKAGALFIGLAKVPAGYKIPAHWHPTDEMVTVLSGTVQMGMGDKLDVKTAKALPAGSMATMPAKHNHFFIAKTAVTIQLSMIGPFEITYVNPDDDPRKGKSADATPAKK